MLTASTKAVAFEDENHFFDCRIFNISSLFIWSVLILAWSDKDKCGDEYEACGDWAVRLNQHKTARGKSFEVIKIPANAWKNVVSLGSENVPAMSTLFLKKDRTSYLYKGPILEAEVYTTVIESWEHKRLSRGKEFLPEKISLSLCQ